MSFRGPAAEIYFVADIANNVIWILNRSDGAVAGRIGHMGRAGRQFHWVHIAVMDSHGNVYAGEWSREASSEIYSAARRHFFPRAFHKSCMQVPGRVV